MWNYLDIVCLCFSWVIEAWFMSLFPKKPNPAYLLFCLAEISEIMEVGAFQHEGAVLSACAILFDFVEDFHTVNLSTWNQSEANVSVTHKLLSHA